MSFRDLPALVTQRQDALTLLEALASASTSVSSPHSSPR